MWRFLIALCVGGVVLSAVASGLAIDDADAPGEPIRVGVYDNRAIAIAFASSRFNPVGEKMAEYEKAKAEGDEARADELEAWGEKLQRQLHRQGFARVPVDDLLAHVKDRLPEVAEAADVDVITWHCNYTGSNADVVDVTDELVALFDPSERALTWAKQIVEQEPVDLDDLEDGHDH